jgi:hypothetical protein
MLNTLQQMKLLTCVAKWDTELDLVTNEDIDSEDKQESKEEKAQQIPTQAALMEALDIINTFYQKTKAPCHHSRPDG